MLVSSNTLPVPSAFLAHTGFVKGWNVSAQQSKGVLAPGCGASAFLCRQSYERRTQNKVEQEVMLKMLTT